jgi:hypothetical protein
MGIRGSKKDVRYQVIPRCRSGRANAVGVSQVGVTERLRLALTAGHRTVVLLHVRRQPSVAVDVLVPGRGTLGRTSWTRQSPDRREWRPRSGPSRRLPPRRGSRPSTCCAPTPMPTCLSLSTRPASSCARSTRSAGRARMKGGFSSRAITTITITITIIIAAGIIITTITTSIFATDRTGPVQHSVAGRFAASLKLKAPARPRPQARRSLLTAEVHLRKQGG